MKSKQKKEKKKTLSMTIKALFNRKKANNDKQKKDNRPFPDSYYNRYDESDA